MKNMYFLTILLTLVAFLSGCNRSEYYAPAKPIKKIASIIQDNGFSKTYEYNSNGDVSKLTEVTYFYYAQSIAYLDTLFSTYTYKKDSIIQTTISHANAKYNRPEYIKYNRALLNSQGYISASIESSAFGQLITFQYDNSGHCIKESDIALLPNPHVVFVSNYSFTNGNMSSIEEGNLLIKYEYYTDKDNTISNESYGSKFRGKGNKNLVKTETVIQNGITSITSYEYEFDKDNYPIKQTTIRGNYKFSETYTYK